MKINLLVEGGDMKPGPTIGQQLGPAGINIGKVISDVNQATKEFKGMKVPVELDIDVKTKNFSVSVSSPPVSELLKKELSLEKGSSAPNSAKVGNLAIEQIIKVAKIKQENMMVSSFKSAVKSVVGSCVSLGILVENKEPKQIEREIDEGAYDKEIKSEKAEVSEDKKEKIAKFFSEIKAKQDKLAAQIAAEEAKKAEQTAAAAPAATATAAAGKTEEKKEEKKPETAKKPGKK